MAIAGLMAVFAVICQPDISLLTGLWDIQLSESGLVNDPFVVGGLGAGLLNAALVLLLSTLLIRQLHTPFTGVTLACLFMLAGFSLMGKNLVNTAPIIWGGWLYARFKREPFSQYVYMTLFGTCLGPMVSFVLVNSHWEIRWLAMGLTGLAIGLMIPPVAAYTVRVHRGYSLYNVGFAAGLLGMAIASVCKGLGVEFATEFNWGQSFHLPLTLLGVAVLLGLLLAGMASGCRSWDAYAPILRHSGRTVTDFIILEGFSRTLVNMALCGAIGFAYLMALYPLGVRMSGPLLCCVFSLAGFGAFGKHPKNMIWPMAGAAAGALLMGNIPFTSTAVLVATLLSTSLAPVAGQFGWYWGIIAGFVHMAMVQNTGILHGGMNLYNNGFAAGIVCMLLVPIIESIGAEQKE